MKALQKARVMNRTLQTLILGSLALVSLTLSVFAPTSAHAGTREACVSEDRIRSEFLKSGPFNFRSDIRIPPYVHCDETNIIYNTARGFLYLKDLPAFVSRIDQIDLGYFELIETMRPYDFVARMIKTIAFLSEDDPKCKGSVAFVTVDEPHTMNICPDANELSAFELASVLVHEAQHAGNSIRHAHVKCKFGVMKEAYVPACDDSYENWGAYYVENEFYVKIARSKSVNGPTRTRARAESIRLLMSRFNRSPLGVFRGALLQTTSGQMKILNEAGLHNIGTVGANDLVTFTSAPRSNPLPYVFSPPSRTKPGRVSRYLFGSPMFEFDSTDGRVSTYFSPDSPSPGSLRDFFITEDYACLVYPNALRCWSNGRRPFTVHLPFEASNILFATAMIQPNTYILRAVNGQHYAMPSSLDELAEYGASSLKSLNQESNILAILPDLHKSDWQLVLTSDFKLIRMNSKDGAYEHLHPELRFKRMLGPIHWSPYFDKI